MAREVKTYDLFDGMTQIVVGDQFSNARETVTIHEREIPDLTARLTIRLIEQHGIIAGSDGGEDSAGRAKIIESHPAHVAQRAYDIASNLVRILREGGHFAVMPKIHETETE